jgi:hypothetical protein
MLFYLQLGDGKELFFIQQRDDDQQFPDNSMACIALVHAVANGVGVVRLMFLIDYTVNSQLIASLQ